MFGDKDLATIEWRGIATGAPARANDLSGPFASLNPRYTIGSLIAEPMYIYKVASNAEIRERTTELLRVVGLRPEYIDRYPHEFSGGQRQRIAVARALSINPEFIIADEPVSALDVSIRAQVLNLLQRLQKQFNLTYLFVSHDLSVVRHVADRIAVMYLGKSSNWRIVMNSMPLPGIPIRRLCFPRYLSRTHRLRSAASVSFFLATYPVQSKFQLVAAFIHDAPWRRISVAKLNLLMRRKKGVSITLHVISLNMSHQVISAG